MSGEPLDLAPIRERLDAATPGPWVWRGNMDNEDPRLVGRNRIGEDGKRKFPGYVEVLWSYPRDRQPSDGEARSYREYLRDLEVQSENGWRSLTSEEIEQRLHDGWLTDENGEPVTERRLCFTSPQCFALDARELAVFEVARAQGLPDDTPRDHPKVYRADIVDVRHPDARLIANAPTDLAALLVEVERLRGIAETCCEQGVGLLAEVRHFRAENAALTPVVEAARAWAAADLAIATGEGDQDAAYAAMDRAESDLHAALTTLDGGPGE